MVNEFILYYSKVTLLDASHWLVGWLVGWFYVTPILVGLFYAEVSLTILIDYMIYFDGMSTRPGLFYAKRLGNYLLCTFIFTCFV